MEFNTPIVGAFITQGWGEPRPDGRQHAGVDISVKKGTRVQSVAEGVVIVSADTSGDAGSIISVKHPNGLVSSYMHLSKRLVGVGKSVKMGQKIAESGGVYGEPGSGDSAKPHLHFALTIDPPLFWTVVNAVNGLKGRALNRGIEIPSEPFVPAKTYSGMVQKSMAKLGLKPPGTAKNYTMQLDPGLVGGGIALLLGVVGGTLGYRLLS